MNILVVDAEVFHLGCNGVLGAVSQSCVRVSKGVVDIIWICQSRGEPTVLQFQALSEKPKKKPIELSRVLMADAFAHKLSWC
jgi:hypothetical protein